MHFTSEDISRNFDPVTLGRARDYLRKGRVVELTIDGQRILGSVDGSGGNVYDQEIRVQSGRNGVRFDGDCSCPMAHNCKHVAAVLLGALTCMDDEEAAVPLAAERWLHQLEALHAQPAFDPDQQILYVLAPDMRDGMLSFYPHFAQVRRGRFNRLVHLSDLQGILRTRPMFLRPEDEEPLQLLAALRGIGRSDGIRPAGRLGARLLSQLCADDRLWLARAFGEIRRGAVHRVGAGPARAAALGWSEPDDDAVEGAVALRWRFDGGTPVDHVLGTQPPCYVDSFALGELTLPAHLAAIAPDALVHAVAQAPLLHPGQRAGVAQRMAELKLDAIVPPPQALQVRERRDVAPVPCLWLDSAYEIVRGEWVWHDFAQLSFEYDGLSTDGVTEPAFRRMDGDTVELILRDFGAEQAAAATLAALGFVAAPDGTPAADHDDALCLPTTEAWLAFARDELPRLQEAGWQVELNGNYRYDLAPIGDWYADVEEDSGGAWFELELGIVVEDKRHPLLPLLLQMIRAAPHEFSAAALAARAADSHVLVELPDTSRVALPWDRVKPILTTLGELYFREHHGDAVRLPFADVARLAELEQAARLRWLGGERMRELGRKLADFDGIRPVEPPAGLQAQLRDYQRSGLAWMQFLREYGFGGILADDMGLGKTIQTLAHVLAEKEAGRLDAPALVVAPTSLMGNWQAEAARFAPGLRVLLLHGKERKEAFDQITEADLVLTTYALLGRDEAALRRHRYHLLILDEAQYIKNSRAKAAQVVCLPEARHRLCLTGTPVQNHLGELWSQFHFLMPGLLGDEKAFKADYRKPIEQQGDVARKDLLARRLKPFMLRRTKDKVATELPPKTEIVLPVELAGAQRDLYETVRVAMDKKVREEIARKGAARSQIVILDALLKLRQVCCDPRLLQPDSAAGSAKLDALMELLDLLVSEGRKVLVFSQFTSMLALVEAELRARGVDYALLTGDTTDRAAPVAAFQEGRVGVFLISLKAGGVGLNLTAADTVIHYDPWWNPAAENQATDRAWRIGQTQPVFVYRLIATGTLEEKIQEMQRRKGELADALLAPEAGLGAALGPDDLQVLFAA